MTCAPRTNEIFGSCAVLTLHPQARPWRDLCLATERPSTSRDDEVSKSHSSRPQASSMGSLTLIHGNIQGPLKILNVARLDSKP